VTGPAAAQPHAASEMPDSCLAPISGGALVRTATPDDVPAVAVAVRELLVELGAVEPSRPAMESAARALVDDRAAGAVLVAEADKAIVGVLGASVQVAMHVAGPYALIQELWVHRAWRSRAIGAALVAALCDFARESELAHIEVGLPRDSFVNVGATEAFYLRNGFEPLGARMRKPVA
jgi:GNAT superfamily N-acetyltransferase